MRTLVLLLPVCTTLAACNMALSDHPMLAGEPKSTVRFMDGLWVAEDPECKFNPRQRTSRWPKCAFWLVLSDGKVVGAKDAKPNDLPVEFVIAAGTPQILEFPLKEEGEKQAKAYAYIAVEPPSLDSTGTATDLQIWMVACGTREAPPHEGELKHFPGLDKDCHPVSVDALRAAASAGPQGTDKKGRLRWIRASAN